MTIDGQVLLNFGSNDYLGLAGDERLIRAAMAATQQFGTGATGSRLTSGHKQLHADLESQIATFKGTEAALVFSSGYLANLGTIAALVGSKDLILSDRFNHSSLKNGSILSGARTIEYAHVDVTSLRLQLDTHRASYRRCLIVTDTVFSMDGDICPLPEILDLAIEYDAMLLSTRFLLGLYSTVLPDNPALSQAASMPIFWTAAAYSSGRTTLKCPIQPSSVNSETCG